MAVMMTCLRRVAVGSVVVLATVVMGQDGMEDMTDMDSMLAAPSGGDGGGGGSHKKEKELTVIQQTTLALQQLGIVIGWSFILFSLSSSLSLQISLLLPLFNLFCETQPSSIQRLSSLSSLVVCPASVTSTLISTI